MRVISGSSRLRACVGESRQPANSASGVRWFQPTFSTHLGDIVGQIYALLVLTVAAAEGAIGLAILVVFFRNRGSIAVEDINLMKG